MPKLRACMAALRPLALMAIQVVAVHTQLVQLPLGSCTTFFNGEYLPRGSPSRFFCWCESVERPSAETSRARRRVSKRRLQRVHDGAGGDPVVQQARLCDHDPAVSARNLSHGTYRHHPPAGGD